MFKVYRQSAVQARLQRLSVHCQPLRLLENTIESEQEQLTHLQAEMRRLESLQPSNRHVAALGVVIRAAQPEQGKLQVQKLSWHAGAPVVTPLASAGTAPTPAATPVTSATLNSSLCLQGVVDNESVLARFVAALHNSAVFQRVDLKSSSHIPDGTGFARQFQIECSCEDRP